jgi:hypothetical protein
MKLTLQQLEAHLWGAANILRGKTAGQDYKNYILSLMFYKRLCDQWECEADDAIAELERQPGRAFSEKEKQSSGSAASPASRFRMDTAYDPTGGSGDCRRLGPGFRRPGADRARSPLRPRNCACLTDPELSLFLVRIGPRWPESDQSLAGSTAGISDGVRTTLIRPAPRSRNADSTA